MTSLQDLSLATLTDCTPGSIEGLLPLKALKKLSFANSGCLDGRALSIIGQLTSLQELHISLSRKHRNMSAVCITSGMSFAFGTSEVKIQDHKPL